MLHGPLEEGECEHEINIYQLGDSNAETLELNDQPSSEWAAYATCRGDFVFQKRGSKNMDKLWHHFHSNEYYPEYYLGIAKKMAICKYPKTGAEEWYNIERLLSDENPKKHSEITVTLNIRGKIYAREYIFMGWVKTPVHEWRMTNGNTLHLEQAFVDGLLPQDKRYLKMTR